MISFSPFSVVVFFVDCRTIRCCSQAGRYDDATYNTGHRQPIQDYRTDIVKTKYCFLMLTGQNDIGQNGTDKMVQTKWYGQNGTDKMVRTKRYGQNGTDKMVRTKWYGQNGTDK